MIAAIHQPNFFPWLGYFNKISRAHTFVFLDHIQLPRKGAGSWVNRVKILINGKEAWLTVPIVRKKKGQGFQLIKDTFISNEPRWREKMIKTMDLNYRKAPHYEETRDSLADLLNFPADNLSDYNQHNIIAISRLLGVPGEKFLRSSDLKVTGKSTELLVNITKAVDCDAYMCGSGAAGYQQDELFEKKGLQVIHQDFNHPGYPQVNAKEFVPGLSIVDALMNVGIEGTKKMILNG
jgi:hypothetical protein